MIYNYIKSPKLLSECQLLAEPNIVKYTAYLKQDGTQIKQSSVTLLASLTTLHGVKNNKNS
jgi:hypothetical protein